MQCGNAAMPARGGARETLIISIYVRELGSGDLGFGVVWIAPSNFEVLRPRIVENSKEWRFQGFPLGPGVEMPHPDPFSAPDA